MQELKQTYPKKVKAMQLQKFIQRQINHGLTMNAEKKENTFYNLRGDCFEEK